MIEQLKILASTTLEPGTGKGQVNVPVIEADTVLNSVLNIVYFAGGVACVIVLVVAGILYATSDGDSSKIKRAKDAILYAIVGLVFIMMAFVITGFVIGRF